MLVETFRRGRAGRPKLLEGEGMVSLGLGWEKQEGLRGRIRAPDCRWELICHRNNLGEIEMEVELELELGRGTKKKGPRPLQARRRSAGR